MKSLVTEGIKIHKNWHSKPIKTVVKTPYYNPEVDLHVITEFIYGVQLNKDYIFYVATSLKGSFSTFSVFKILAKSEYYIGMNDYSTGKFITSTPTHHKSMLKSFLLRGSFLFLAFNTDQGNFRTIRHSRKPR